MRNALITVIFMLMAPVAGTGQTAGQYRGVYVDRFDKLLQDTSGSRRFLIWAQQNHIQHLSCYDLYTVLSSRDLTARLVDFMQLAKQGYQVRTFDAVAASAEFLIDKVYPFNLAYVSKDIGFSGFHLEREWWTEEVTFISHRENMERLSLFIRDSSAIGGLSLETYIGWFGLAHTSKEEEANVLIRYADVISVSAYQKHIHFSYLRSRLEELAKAAERAHKKQDIIILFSMEKAFSGQYSRKHSYQEMYDKLMKEYMQALKKGDIDPHAAAYLNIKGWKVFAQSYARRYRP